MAKWSVICIDEDLKTGQKTGALYAMSVPGGMLMRVCSQLGESLSFVPMKEIMVAPRISNIDAWIEENKVT